MKSRIPPRVRGIGNRLYSDFLLPSRLHEFRALLAEALERGYEFQPISRLWRSIKDGKSPGPGKLIVLRHDIDTDVRTARQLWEAARELGVQGSYYFRLSTLDVPLMQAIDRSGGEASYHYEELSTYAKQHRLRTRDEIEVHLPEIRENFLKNLAWVRQCSGLPMEVVASHGDWHNRRTGMINARILEDRATREKAGVSLEVYDDAFMKHVTSRHSDMGYPKFWKPSNPWQAIANEEPFIYILIHPRHWQSNIPVNMLDNVQRAWEEVRFSL